MAHPTRLPRLALIGLALFACAASPVFGQKSRKSAPAPAQNDDRPNLILIIADDLGWEDSAPYGNSAVRTPHLERLAREGMRFDAGFVTASSCSPSRASLLTGRYPHQTGAEELHWPLPKEQVTFVEKLKSAGYWTGAAGKWHLGEAMKERFNEVREANPEGFHLPASKQKAAPEPPKSEAESGCEEWLPLLAKRPRGKPFFLWLASLDPHRAWSEKAVEPPHDPIKTRLAPYHPDTPAVRSDYARYYDEISRLDENIGKLLEALEEQKLEKNTLILFISDNGRPFPRDKSTLYDSGIRTPWIVRWPDKVSPGRICQQIVSTVDIAPAFLKLAQVKDAGNTFEGRSFLPLLEHPDRPIREFVFAEKNWHDYEDHGRAIRTQRYKYIRNSYPDLPLTPSADAGRSPAGAALRQWRDEGRLLPHQRTIFTVPRPREELYDTIDDPHELRNLAADAGHAIALETLRDALSDWEKETGDRVPDLRTADEFDRETGEPTAARTWPRWDRARMVGAGLAAP